MPRRRYACRDAGEVQAPVARSARGPGFLGGAAAPPYQYRGQRRRRVREVAHPVGRSCCSAQINAPTGLCVQGRRARAKRPLLGRPGGQDSWAERQLRPTNKGGQRRRRVREVAHPVGRSCCSAQINAPTGLCVQGRGRGPSARCSVAPGARILGRSGSSSLPIKGQSVQTGGSACVTKVAPQAAARLAAASSCRFCLRLPAGALLDASPGM